MTAELRVYPRHIRGAGFCHRSGRIWFPQHGLSWSDFVENGIPASVMEATGDEAALQVVAAARKEAAE